MIGFTNGLLWECRGKNTIIVRGGKIIDIGGRRILWKYNPKKVYDFEDLPVYPGFIDSHMHLRHLGSSLFHLDLSNVRSKKEFEKKCVEYSRKKRNYVIGYNWDETMWEDGEEPTPESINKIFPNKPCILVRICGHKALINDIMRDRLNMRKNVITEYEVKKALNSIKMSENMIKDMISAAIDYSIKHGITCAHDIESLDVARLMIAMNIKIRLRLYLRDCEVINAIKLRNSFENEKLRIMGIKLFSDGSVGAGTAYLTKEYKNGGRGNLLMNKYDIAKKVADSEKNNLQCMIHGIGDGAIKEIVEGFKIAARNLNIKKFKIRHRIEHFEMANFQMMRSAKRLGLICSMQPNFIGNWGHPGGMMQSKLGNRYIYCNRLSDMKKLRVPMCFGSDCMPLSPIYGIHSAVNAPFKRQKLSVKDAIKMYTFWSAYASHDEKKLGSIKVGKFCDLVLLSESIEDAESIKDVKVVSTIVGGKYVWKKESSLFQIKAT